MGGALHSLGGIGIITQFCCSGFGGCETGQDVRVGHVANCADLAASSASLFKI